MKFEVYNGFTQLPKSVAFICFQGSGFRAQDLKGLGSRVWGLGPQVTTNKDSYIGRPKRAKNLLHILEVVFHAAAVATVVRIAPSHH